MSVQIEIAQDGKHYIVSVKIAEDVWIQKTLDEKDFQFLKQQISIIEEK